MFSAEAYKKQLENATDIETCEKLRPIVRDNTYIFISYCHKDYKNVYSDLADLYAAGARFRYDAEFLPGLEWDEEQVRQIIEAPQCVGVIFYMSVDSLKSQSVHKEIKMVADSGKLSFAINLIDMNPTDMFNKAAELTIQPLMQSMQSIGNDFVELNRINAKISQITESFNLAQNIILGPDAKNPSRIILDRPKLNDQSSTYLKSLKYGIRERFNVLPETEIEILFEGKYIGDWKNGMRHGHGVLETNLNERYDGDWKNDKPNGHGIFTYAEGGTRRYYDGEWKDGKKCGQGKMVFTNGNCYEGEWKNDVRDGHGVYTNSFNNIYDGEWKNDKENGQGTFTYFDGKQWIGESKDNKFWTGSGFLHYYNANNEVMKKTYEGELKEGQYHGHGVLSYEYGAVYDGEWVEGKREGTGAYTYADEGENKRTYVGEWENDVPKHGVFTNKSKETYEGDFNGWSFEGHGIKRYDDKTVYDGEWKNGKRDGIGTFTYFDGKQWVGEFKDGNKWNGSGFLHYYSKGELLKKTYEGEMKGGEYHGHGVLSYEDGAVYDGEWVEGKREGTGAYTYADEGENKRTYVGEWENDVPKHGVFTNKSKETYEGDFNGWSFEGHGIKRYDDKAVYDGEWKNGKRNGIGTYVYGDEGENKRTYVGEWKEDRMEGKGLFTYRDKSTYEGDFVDWKKQGHGVYTYSSSHDVYDGEWQNGNENGQGTYTYFDGKQWVGEFKDGKKWTGSGFLHYYSKGELLKETYEGEMKEGQYHGHGVLRYEDDAVYDGEWKNGKRDGIGTYVYGDEGENKRTYVGEWKEDRMEGKGLFTYRDKSTYDGDFVNGKRHGHGVYTFPDGKQWIGEFKDDNKWNGSGFLYFYKNGKLTGDHYEGELQEGQLHGHGVYTYADGSAYDGEWKNGKKSGHGVYTSALSDEIGPMVKTTQEGTWRNNQFVEGYQSIQRRKLDGSFKEAYCWEGKWIANGKPVGIITLKNKKHFKTRLALPYSEFALILPNIWLFRWTFSDYLDHIIWQFESETSDTPDGYGTAIYIDGTEIEGQFSGGKLAPDQPHVIYRFASGDVYEGEWKNGQPDGYGVMAYADGSVYEGEWAAYEKSGKGKMTLADGGCYEGEWENGHPNGKCTYTAPDGTVLSGIWKDGKLIETDKKD